MDNYKKIFFEILEGIDISPFKKSLFLKQIYEINFELYEEKSRHYGLIFRTHQKRDDKLSSKELM